MLVNAYWISFKARSAWYNWICIK